MIIRAGTTADLKECIALDDSFETEYVWQMDEKSQPSAIDIAFRLRHLPRPLRVTGLISGEDLTKDLRSGGMLFIAREQGVRGFLDLTVSKWNQAALINNLAVAPESRRRGVGTLLMRTALDWARKQKLRVALLDTSTKAYPAICFYQKQGFVFCGFNDQLYPKRDIALYFSQSLR